MKAIDSGKQRWTDVSRIIQMKMPFIITALRGFTAPLLLHTIIAGLGTPAKALLLVACLTDPLDGHLARRTGVSSDIGAYFDVTVDFLVIIAAFLGFVAIGVYPFWLPVIVTLTFIQFIASSRFGRPFYDPIGRYYGTFLFASIGVTLFFPSDSLFATMPILVLMVTLVSVTSRWLEIWKANLSPGR